jgi:hypothetical protein
LTVIEREKGVSQEPQKQVYDKTFTVGCRLSRVDGLIKLQQAYLGYV